MDDVLKLLTFLVACGLAYLAYQQFQLARAKFKLDLFEKRMATYKATRSLLMAMVNRAPAEQKEIDEFRVAVADAPFLFDMDVNTYIVEIDKRATTWIALDSRSKQPPSGADVNSYIDREEAEEIWFKNQLVEINTKFMPYLGIHTWR